MFFAAPNDEEHLHLIEKAFGPIPYWMTQQSMKYKYNFNNLFTKSGSGIAENTTHKESYTQIEAKIKHFLNIDVFLYIII